MEDYNEGTGRIYRQLRRANRFDNYREITARRSEAGACGHAIKAGDRIGWNRAHGAQCPACWSRWCGDNAMAAQDEAFMAGGY